MSVGQSEAKKEKEKKRKYVSCQKNMTVIWQSVLRQPGKKVRRKPLTGL